MVREKRLPERGRDIDYTLKEKKNPRAQNYIYQRE